MPIQQNRKIKVLHLIDGLAGGGSQKWVYEIVRLANKGRFESSVCYYFEKPGFNYKDDIRKLNVKIVWLDGGRIKPTSEDLSFKEKPLFERLNLLFYYINRATRCMINTIFYIKKNRPDVIHTHLYLSPFVGGILGKIFRVPVVHMVPAMKSQIDLWYPWTFAAYKRFQSLFRFFFTAYREELINYTDVPEDKIKLLTGTIDLDSVVKIPRHENPVVAEFNLGEAYPILLGVGRMHSEKGHIYSIEAVKILKERFPGVKLILLGEGHELEQIRQLVSQWGLSGQVIMPGFRADQHNFYSLADIYLRTTLYESGNLSSYLAMAYGLPVIGFDNKASIEAITSGENGLLVPTKDVESLAARAIELIEDKSEQRRLGENAADYVRDNLDIKQTIHSFEQTYLDLAKPPLSPIPKS